jgi:hypothetical protein
VKPVDRQKICSHCDGRIAIEAENCPYCGTLSSTQEEAVAPAPLFDHKSIQDSLTTLYSPPYSNKSSPIMKQDKDKNKPKPFVKESHENQLNASLGKFNYSSSAPVIETEEKVEEKSSFTPLLLMLLGGNLLIIGLLQFFFSESGILRLEWQSKYWFIYCLIAVPALYMGYKKAGLCKDKAE